MVFLLSFFFLLSRTLHLLFCFPEPVAEDLIMGILPKDLIEGLRIPFFEYAVVHYHGGTLVYGVLTVPFFLLFGKTVFALRLTGVLFQWGTFITWFLFMRRFFGQKAALFTAFLYLFSPPWLTLYAMYGHGAHAESLLFTAVGLFLLFRILYERDRPIRDAACLGLVSGFGTYFTYGVFVSVIAFILFWWYEDRSCFKKKEFLFSVLFFLIGFSPWIAYNILHQFHGVDRLRDAFTYPGWERVFIIPFHFLKLATLKILGILSFNYRAGFRYHPHITPFNWIYYAAILLSYGILYRFEKKNRKTHFFFLFPLLYLLAASVGRFPIEPYMNRYFVPFFPFFFAVIGLGLTHLGSRSIRLQKGSILLLVLLLAMGLKGEFNLLSPKEFGLSLKHQGYSYYQLGWKFMFRYPEDLDQLSSLGKRVDLRLSGPERFAFHLGLRELYYQFERVGDLQKYLLWAKNFDRTYWPLYLSEIGRAWGFSDGLLSEKIDTLEKSSDKEDQPYLIEGLMGHLHAPGMRPDRMSEYAFGWIGKISPQNEKALAYALGKLSWQHSTSSSFLYKIKRHREIESRFQKGLLPSYYRGVGSLMAELYDPLSGEWPIVLMQKLKRIDKEWQEAIFWGAGFEAPLQFEDPYDVEGMAAAVPPKFRKAFEEGVSDRFAWGGRNRWIEVEPKTTSSPQVTHSLLE